MISSAQSASVIRWTARIWTAASLLFLSAFIFGGAERTGNWPTITQWVGLAFFPTGTVLGLLMALRKEVLGGGIAVASLIGIYTWRFVVAGHLAGPWFALIAAPGLLFLISGLLTNSSPVEPARQHHH
jgi:hypothetical protein